MTLQHAVLYGNKFKTGDGSRCFYLSALQTFFFFFLAQRAIHSPCWIPASVPFSMAVAEHKHKHPASPSMFYYREPRLWHKGWSIQ
jgi:hypothetical protein